MADQGSRPAPDGETVPEEAMFGGKGYLVFGNGPLSRAAAQVYRIIVLQLSLTIATAPTIIGMFFLGRDLASIAIAALLMFPIGPAAVAAISSVHAWRKKDLQPGKDFWSAWKRELFVAILWWLPAVAVLALLSLSLASAAASGQTGFAVVLIVILVILCLWSGTMALLQARFSFRLRDYARLAIACMITQWRYTFGLLCIFFVMFAVTYFTSEVVTGLLGWAWILMMTAVAEPVVEYVTEGFTSGPA